MPLRAPLSTSYPTTSIQYQERAFAGGLGASGPAVLAASPSPILCGELQPGKQVVLTGKVPSLNLSICVPVRCDSTDRRCPLLSMRLSTISLSTWPLFVGYVGAFGPVQYIPSYAISADVMTARFSLLSRADPVYCIGIGSHHKRLFYQHDATTLLLH